MYIEYLQKLCRSNITQILYHRTKEMGSLQLFDNNKDLSYLQVLYLYYCELYASLYTDLSMGEEFISEDVIKDSLRTEAYLLYKKVNRKNKKNSQHLPTHTGGAGSLIFKRGKK
jgi:hypothetical protein